MRIKIGFRKQASGRKRNDGQRPEQFLVEISGADSIDGLRENSTDITGTIYWGGERQCAGKLYRHAWPPKLNVQKGTDLFERLLKMWISQAREGGSFAEATAEINFGKKGPTLDIHIPGDGLTAVPLSDSGVTAPDHFRDDGYCREIGQRRDEIIGLHRKLARQFKRWLESHGCTDIRAEVEYVDIEFRRGDEFCRAELKTCAHVGSRIGIREALGQLLEYNCYHPNRTAADSWWIVLDKQPSDDDIRFMDRLHVERKLPLQLAWWSGSGADFRVEALPIDP